MDRTLSYPRQNRVEWSLDPLGRPGSVVRVEHHGVDAAGVHAAGCVLLILAALEPGADSVSEILDDTHVLNPVVVRLRLSPLRLLRRRTDRRHPVIARLGGGSSSVRRLVGRPAAAGTLENTAGEATLVMGEVGAEASGRRVGEAGAAGQSRIRDRGRAVARRGRQARGRGARRMPGCV